MTSAVAAIHTANSGSVPGKIIIRGTSKLSLKDRFARLSNEMQHQQSANEVALSAANRRLAQELGNNPDVVAALHMKRKSAFQRLGVKSRLGIPAGLRQNGFQQNGFQQQRGYEQRNGFSPFRRGYRNFGGGQFAYFNNGYRRPRNFGPSFGPKRMENNRMGSFSGFGFARGGFRKRFRGGGGNWRFGRGGRGRGGMQNQNERMSREELDRQLDEYMSKTKTALDDDLDAYMGEATI